MANQSPRDMREYLRNLERLAKNGNRAARMLIEKSPGGSVEGIEQIIEANKKLTPAAPVELVVQTAIYMTPELRQLGTATMTFAPVTKAVTGQDLVIDRYELWGRDLTANALNDTTAPYPDVTAPGLSFPGQGFHVNPAKQPPLVMLATGPNPDLTANSLALNSTWMLRVRAIGAFTVAPGMWSEEREVRIVPDDTPPPQPTKPILNVTLGTIGVRWDSMSVSGPMPSDFKTLHVAQGGNPAPETIVAELDRTNNLFVIPDAPYYAPQFFRFRAEDMSGNLSPWSEMDVAVTSPLVDSSEMEEVLRKAREELAAAKEQLEAELGALEGDLAELDSAVTAVEGVVVDLGTAVTAVETKAEDALTAAGDANTAAGAAQTAAEDAAQRAREMAMILTNKITNPEFELGFEDWTPLPADKWTLVHNAAFGNIAIGTSTANQKITLTHNGMHTAGTLPSVPELNNGTTVAIVNPGIWRFSVEAVASTVNAGITITLAGGGVDPIVISAPFVMRPSGVSLAQVTLNAEVTGYIACSIFQQTPTGSETITVVSASLADITELQNVGDVANDALNTANAKGKTFIQSTPPLGLGLSYRWKGTAHASASEEIDETGAVLRTNLATNPQPGSITGWGTSANYNRTFETMFGRPAMVCTRAAAGPSVYLWYGRNTGLLTSSSGTPTNMAGLPAVTPGQTINVLVDMGTSRANTYMSLNIRWFNASGGALTVVNGSNQIAPVNGWQTVSISGVAPANAAFFYVENIVSTMSGNTVGGEKSWASRVYMSTTAGTYFDGSTPSSTVGFSNSLWIDTTGGANTPKRWNGTTWLEVTDKVAKDAAQAAVDAKEAAEAAADTANEALRQAGLAQDSADGKNNVFYDEPLGTSTLVKGDTWFDRPNGLIKVWSGTAWVEPQLGTNAFKDLAITNAKIFNLDGVKITAQSIKGISIAAQTITVDKLLVGSTDNFINESDFTNGGASWSLAANRQIIAGQARNGGPVFRLTGGTTINSAYNKPDARPLTGSTVWRVVAWVRSSVNVASNTYTFFARTRDAAGTFTYPGLTPIPPALVGGVWTKVTGTITAADTAIDYTFAMSLRADYPTGAYLDIDTISATRMGDGSLIVDGAVTADSIAANSITAAKIVAGTITATEIATNAITSDKILANAIIAGKIAANAVTATTIAANAVIAGKIATDAVTSNTIVANAITTAKIATNAVTANEIAANTITSNEINAGSIRTAILVADSITTSMIKADALTVKHTITASTYQTETAANRGIKLDATGLRAWTSGGNQTVDIDAVTGYASISGRFKSAMPGQPGVVIVPSAESSDSTTMGIWFAPNVDNIPGGVTGGVWTAKLPTSMISTYPLNLRGANGGGVDIYNNLKVFGIGSLPGTITGNAGLTLQTSDTKAVDVVNNGYDYTMMHKNFSATGCYNGYYLNGTHNAVIGIGGRYNNNVGVEGLARGVVLAAASGFSVIAPAVYARTTGSAANVVVGTDGALWRSTSSLKYKVMVSEMELPESLLGVRVKDWRDKDAAERYADAIENRPIGCMTKLQQVEFDAISIDRIPGAIAEEVHAAGGEQFIQYGDDGEIEGLMYDRFALARTQLLSDKLDAALARIEQLEAMVK